MLFIAAIQKSQTIDFPLLAFLFVIFALNIAHFVMLLAPQVTLLPITKQVDSGRRSVRRGSRAPTDYPVLCPLPLRFPILGPDLPPRDHQSTREDEERRTVLFKSLVSLQSSFELVHL